MNARLVFMWLLPAALTSGGALQAATVIAPINGYYDVDGYDTPSLHIDNPTIYAFTNVQMKLTGYQGLNSGLSEGVHLADIAGGTNAIVSWGSIPNVNGSLSAKNLFAYDYDDQYGGTFNAQTGYGLDGSHNLVLAPQCASQGWQNCAQVGNFYVTFTATWNGKPIYSQFSPDPNLAGAGNAAGTFVGWEGLDQNGWSETTYDSHSNGGPNGVLADIFLGAPPSVSGAPEPASILLMAGGLLLGVLVGGIRSASEKHTQGEQFR